MKATKKIIAIITSVILFVLMAPMSVFAEGAAEADESAAAAIASDFVGTFKNVGSINTTVLIVAVIFLLSFMTVLFTFPARKKRKSSN